MKGTEYLLRALSAEGVGHLFFVPGGLIDPFLPAFAAVPAVRPVIAAMEGGAAYMADGYARASGNFGACLAIGGPGLTNMTTPISAAQSDGSPVLVMSGEVSTSMEGLGQFQDASAGTFNDTEILEPITALSMSVENPKLLNRDFRKALVTMFGPPHQPVHISLPQDVQKADFTAEHEPIEPGVRRPHALDTDAADRVWERIARSRRIAIYAGAGVEHSEASELLRKLAEAFDIPVATTLRAKGVFPEDHPLSLGVFGYAGTRHSAEAFLAGGMELLIVLGSSLNERDSMHWSAKLSPANGMIQVNISAKAIGKVYPAGVAVVGDSAAFLRHLLQAPPESLRALEEGRVERRSWLEKIRGCGPRLYDAENCLSEAVPIHPARIVSELRKAMPRDSVVLVDSGAHRAFAGHYWESYEPRHYISATTLGPMGWAIPAAVGAKLAQPGRPCAVITGDACMLMHGMEIQSAARFNASILYVVINNAAFGNVWLRADKMGEVPSRLTSLPDHDWAGFARALGVQAATVTQPGDLAGAFAKALAAGTAYLIDVKADKHFSTPVEPYAEAVKAWSYHE